MTTISNFPTSFMDKELHVSNAILLLLYLLMPASILIILIDALFFDGSIKASLPDEPDRWAFWTVIFNLPHIIASIVTFADKEYITYYKKSLITGSIIVLFLAAGVPLLLGNIAAFILMACYTMYHVMMQQFGIGLMMFKLKPDSNYHYWRISSIIAASLLFIMVYSQQQIPTDITIFIKAVITICLVFSCWFAYELYRKAKTNGGAEGIALWYFIGNASMVSLCYIFFLTGYNVFVIIIPRVIHDLSAYIIYIVHDHNRNRTKTRNFLYAPFIMVGISPLLMCIPISASISYALMYFHDYYFITITVFFLIFFPTSALFKNSVILNGCISIG